MKITSKEIKEMIVEEMKMDEIIGYMAKSARDAIFGKKCAKGWLTFWHAKRQLLGSTNTTKMGGGAGLSNAILMVFLSAKVIILETDFHR